jgi:hypothetical protein
MRWKPLIRTLALLACLAAGSTATPARAATAKATQFTTFLTARQFVREQRLILQEMRFEQRILTRQLNTLNRELRRGQISFSFFTMARQFVVRSYVQTITFLVNELGSLTPIR